MPIVLYVDDQPAMARAVERWLRRRGTRVRAARTIAEAKQRFEGDAYDGVFIDLWLNDGSGFELYDWIVEHRPDLADRVAFVTADFIQHGLATARMRLVDRPVLVKPFDLTELDRCVEGWIGAVPEVASGVASARTDAEAPHEGNGRRARVAGGVGGGTGGDGARTA